ncbi:TonB-dependent receptor [bacterium]|nr:TonB-dependent receptor [bacterium]
MIKKILKLYCLLFCFGSALAQQTKQELGTIRGKIIDKSNGENLIGAIVTIEGTSWGASADLDGNFFLKVPVGTRDVRASFVTYKSKLVSGILIKPDEITKLDFALEPDVIQTEEVVVEATASNEVENGLLLAQKKSNKIFDGISAQQISKNSDSNVGAALKRVTGVSIVGGKDVFVRGLGNRYANVQLNGSQLPSTNPNQKEVPLDVFASNLIDNIIVQKTYTADQPGDFSGGSVQIETKDFPETKTFNVSLSTNYNSQSTFKKGLTYNGSKTDFLGFDSGKRKLPSVTNDGLLTDEKGVTAINDFQNSWSPKSANSMPGQNYSISYGNQFPIGEKTLGVIASLNYSYSNTIKNEDYRSIINSSGNQTTLGSDYKIQKNTANTNLGGILNLYFKPNSFTKIGLKNIYTNNSENETKALQGFYYNSGGDYKQTVLKFTQRSIFASNLVYESYFNNFLNSKLAVEGSFATAKRYEPDTRNTHYAFNESKNVFEIVLDKRGNYHFFSEQNDTDLNLKTSYELKPAPKLKLKIGGLALQKDRDFQARKFLLSEGNKELYPTETKSKTPEEALSPTLVENGALKFSEQTQATDSYKGEQFLWASYLSTDFQTTEKLSFILGARVENSNQKVNQKSVLNETNILPAFNGNYKLSETQNLRTAFSITLARPEFRELSNFFFGDFIGSKVVYGNPKLKQTKIYNYDLRWEFYPELGELFAVSAFYKRFNNPIELFFRATQNLEVQYNNVDLANLYGLEFEARKNFWENLKLTANLSLIKSEVDYGNETVKASQQANRKRPMFGQSPYTLNLSVFYLVEMINTELNLAYNRFGKRISSVGNYEQGDDEYEMPFDKVDFVAAYKLRNYTCKVSFQNLLNDKVVFKQNGVVTNGYKLGRTISANISYSF